MKTYCSVIKFNFIKPISENTINDIINVSKLKSIQPN